MSPAELAALLNGRAYRSEITAAEAAAAKAAGLVVLFGASDDLAELRGAINDEVGAYDGTTLRITPVGLLPDWESLDASDEQEAEAYFLKKHAGFQTIEAVWCPEDTVSWAYKTAIPHVTFDVLEDGAPYCRGIVFALSDVSTEGDRRG